MSAPTPAAGGDWTIASIRQALTDKCISARELAADYLARNDAYHFFDPLGALLRTGPTHTNVCDIRVVLVDRE